MYTSFKENFHNLTRTILTQKQEIFHARTPVFFLNIFINATNKLPHWFIIKVIFNLPWMMQKPYAETYNP